MTEIRITISPKGITVTPMSAFAFKTTMVVWLVDCQRDGVSRVRISFNKRVQAPYFSDSTKGTKEERKYHEFTDDCVPGTVIWGEAPRLVAGQQRDEYTVYALKSNDEVVDHLDPEIITDDPPPEH